MKKATTFLIKDTHPSIAGHFPGHPIVPAAVILQQVFNFAKQCFPPLAVIEISRLKFIRPLQPGVHCDISLSCQDSKIIECTAMVADQRILSGQLVLGKI